MIRLNRTEYLDGSNSSEYLVQTTTFLPEIFTYTQNELCQEQLPCIEDLIEVNLTDNTIEETEQKFTRFFDTRIGGNWKLKDQPNQPKLLQFIEFLGYSHIQRSPSHRLRSGL